MRDSHHNPSIREQLDAVRPDSDDLADPGLQQAAAAVEASPAWRRLFASQREIDRRIADAMLDVELPENARQSLLEVLAAARTAAVATSLDDPLSQPEAEQAHRRPRSMNRRDWTRLAVAAATVACLGIGALFWYGRTAPLPLDDVRSEIPLTANGQINIQGLTAFDDSFPLSLPTGRWERVQFDDPRGLDWSRDGRHDAAILSFVTTGRKPVRGYLLIVPITAIADPPNRTYFSTAEISYVPLDNSAAISPAGDLVYLCFAEPGKLDDLARLLYPQSA